MEPTSNYRASPVGHVKRNITQLAWLVFTIVIIDNQKSDNPEKNEI